MPEFSEGVSGVLIPPPSEGSVSGAYPLPSGVISKLAAAVERLGARLPAATFPLALLILMAASVMSSGGGLLGPELDLYIPHYLSQRPLMQKIYDTSHVEMGSEYRPRPLSYLVDNYDVAFIGWSTRIGHPHLLSASTYIFWFLDALLLWRFFRSYLHLDRLTSALIIGLLSTDPVLYMTTGYFRSAKGGATCCLLASFLAFSNCFRNTINQTSYRRRLLPAVLGALLFLTACLFDEQPAALGLAALLLLTLFWLLNRKTPAGEGYLYSLASLALSLSVFAFYDLVLHRKLLTLFSGQVASMDYQTGLLSSMLLDPIGRLLASTGVLADEFGFLTGDLSTVLALALMFALAITYSLTPGNKPPSLQSSSIARQLNYPPFQILLGALLLIGFIFVMVQRHPPLLLPTVRRANYYIPLAVIFLIMLAGAVVRLINHRYLSRGLAQLLLILILCSNIVSLRHHKQLIVFSDLKPRFDLTRALLNALRNKSGVTPAMLQDPQQGTINTEVSRDAAYLALHKIRLEGR